MGISRQYELAPAGATKNTVILRTTWLLISFSVVMATAFFVLLWVTGTANFASLSDAAGMDSSAVGRVVETDVLGRRTCRVTYEFQANGRTYRGPERSGVYIKRDCFFLRDDSVIVRYDGANPAHNTLAAGEVLRPRFITSVLALLALPPLWVLGVVYTLWRAHRELSRLAVAYTPFGSGPATYYR